jgi:hypothetical protein
MKRGKTPLWFYQNNRWMEARMLSRRFIKILLVALALFAATLACAMPTFQEPQKPTAISQNVIETRAVETLSVLLTEAAPRPTDMVVSNPTATAQAPTLSPSSTPEPQATATQAPVIEPTATATATLVPTATSIPLPCEQAGFVTDVSVPDGTALPAGSPFTKTWRLKNTGTCTWTTDFALVFASGESMSGPASQKLASSVLPGQTIDVSVPLKAPGQPGQYRGNWKMRNASGVLFGLGNQNQTFYVDIKVIPTNTTGGGYDFSANYCVAEWTTSAGKTLSCAEKDGSADGFILYKSRPVLENGSIDDEPALITNPARTTDSVLRGKYPAYTVQTGDHFKSIIGCEHNAKNCNVRFQLDYQIDNGPIQTLGSWNEALDNNFTVLDIDLSSLAGKNVRFILTVLANGASDNDRAQWLLPRIEKVNLTVIKPDASSN